MAERPAPERPAPERPAPERLAPEVTVSVPGVAGPLDLLDTEPPPRLPPTRGQRGLVAASAVVLLAGLVVVAGERGEPVAPVPVVEPAPPSISARPTDDGVLAVARDGGLLDGGTVARLGLLIEVEPTGGPGDSQSPSLDEQITLLGVTAAGFGVRFTGVQAPFSLGQVGRQGLRVGFDLDVAVIDCSVPTQAQRRLDLQLQRGGGPVSQVRVATASDVVRRLDRLVARTCRRPRG